MRILYWDLGMGAAGDMLAASLLELLPEPQRFLEEFNHLGIPGVTVSAEPVSRCGVKGTHLRVRVNGAEEDEHLHEHTEKTGAHHTEQHEGHHHHTTLHDVRELVSTLSIPARVRENVLAVYDALAAAESRVHGTTVEEIHFHEVGTMDAVADVTMVCLLLHRLAPQEIVASPVNVGGGTVRCAHGVLPVPAPATAELLRGIPIYGGEVQSELCTPTGAALLRHFVTRFGALPPMAVEAVGYGMGTKEFARANCVRAMLGESTAEEERIVELSCNVDDMTGEEIGFAMEMLYDAGAVEVFTVPVGMKKNRPGILLETLCREADREAVLRALFRHTSSIGVRETCPRRHVLHRESVQVETAQGSVRRKNVEGYGVRRGKYEFEDLARIARAEGLSLPEVRRLAEEAERQ